MTLGLAERQGDLLDDISRFCGRTLGHDSIYSFLHRERDNLFPDEFFDDLFSERGRRSVPPSVVATVMVLQRLEGLSDREAAEHYTFDARWRYAAGVGGYDGEGRWSFVHTVLVEMRARLRNSERPNRVFDAALGTAAAAGLVGRKRVLDSTPLYDAVATMDTVTLIRSAIRGLLAVVGQPLEDELRAQLRRDDDYVKVGKPICDYDDRAAREQLVDDLARDANALLLKLDGRSMETAVRQAAALLATVAGQDLDQGDDGVFRIARRVAKDRVISTVDPQARHGHKTSARSFDGYKGHISMDPDSEFITATAVSAGNVGDADAAPELLAGELPAMDRKAKERRAAEAEAPPTVCGDAASDGELPHGPASAVAVDPDSETITAPAASTTNVEHDAIADQPVADDEPSKDHVGTGADTSAEREGEVPLAVYGDAAYGSGEMVRTLETDGATVMVKVQPPVAPGGHFSKEKFTIDLKAGTVVCPANVTASIRRNADGSGVAAFGDACTGCPLASNCTTASRGRIITINKHEEELTRARATQADDAWKTDYRANRPKVERKLAHMMRRKHGGRRARVRGQPKVAADFALLGAAVNLARLAVRGVHHTGGGWAVAVG